MTIQDVIDAEILKGDLKKEEIHFGDKVDTKHGVMHHEFCMVRPTGTSSPGFEMPAVVIIASFSPTLIHVMGNRKLFCLRDELYLQDLEFVRWVDHD